MRGVMPSPLPGPSTISQVGMLIRPCGLPSAVTPSRRFSESAPRRIRGRRISSSVVASAYIEKGAGRQAYNAGSRKPAAQEYRVRSGDTISHIALRFGTTSDHISQLNPVARRTGVINVGEVLTVPAKPTSRAVGSSPVVSLGKAAVGSAGYLAAALLAVGVAVKVAQAATGVVGKARGARKRTEDIVAASARRLVDGFQIKLDRLRDTLDKEDGALDAASEEWERGVAELEAKLAEVRKGAVPAHSVNEGNARAVLDAAASARSVLASFERAKAGALNQDARRKQAWWGPRGQMDRLLSVRPLVSAEVAAAHQLADARLAESRRAHASIQAASATLELNPPRGDELERAKSKLNQARTGEAKLAAEAASLATLAAEFESSFRRQEMELAALESRANATASRAAGLGTKLMSGSLPAAVKEFLSEFAPAIARAEEAEEARLVREEAEGRAAATAAGKSEQDVVGERVASLAQDATALGGRARAKETEIMDVEAEASSSVETIRRELGVLRQQVAATEEVLASHRATSAEEVQALLGDIISLVGMAAEREQELSLSPTAVRAAALRQEIQQLTGDVREGERAIAELRAAAAARTAELEEEAGHVASALAAKEGELFDREADYKREIMALQGEVAALTEEVQSKQREIERAREGASEGVKEASSEAAASAREELEKDMAALRAASEGKDRALQEAVAQAEADRAAYEAEVAELKETLGARDQAFRDAMEESTLELHALRATVADLQLALEQESEKVVALEAARLDLLASGGGDAAALAAQVGELEGLLSEREMELEDVKEQVIRETQNARELLADASAAGAALRQAFEVMKNKALRFEEEIASLSNVREQQEEAEAFAAEAMRQVELSRAAAQASQERIAELEGAMRRQQAGPGAPSQELAQELEALEQESLMREAALGDLRVQSENTSRELKALQGALKAREFELDEVRRAAGRDRQRAEEELELARAEANKFSDELQALRKSTPAMDLTGLVEVDVLREAVAIGEGLSSRVEELEADVEAKRGELQQLMEKSSREAEEAQATLATALARAAGLDSQFRDLVGLLSKNMDGGGQAAVMAIQETLAAGSGAAVGFTAAAASTNGRARGQSDVAQRAWGAIDTGGGVGGGAAAFPRVSRAPAHLSLASGVANIPPFGMAQHFVLRLEGVGEAGEANALVMGVAAGLPKWAEDGVDPAAYPRELMRNAAQAMASGEGVRSLSSVVDAAQVAVAVPGSATAGLLEMDSAGGLRGFNIGDSGYCLVRDGAVVYRTARQMHSPRSPYQLAHRRFQSGTDTASDGTEVALATIPGDVVVLASDGLFYNVRSEDIGRVVLQAGRGQRGAARARAIATELASLASANSTDRDFVSPWAAEDRALGEGGSGRPGWMKLVGGRKRAAAKKGGGKGDGVRDITVVVGVVEADV